VNLLWFPDCAALQKWGRLDPGIGEASAFVGFRRDQLAEAIRKYRIRLMWHRRGAPIFSSHGLDATTTTPLNAPSPNLRRSFGPAGRREQTGLQTPTEE